MLEPKCKSNSDGYILAGDYYGFINQQAMIQRALDAEAKLAHYGTLDTCAFNVEYPKTYEERLRQIALVYEQSLRVNRA